jgi:hypothetical protein
MGQEFRSGNRHAVDAQEQAIDAVDHGLDERCSIPAELAGGWDVDDGEQADEEMHAANLLDQVGLERAAGYHRAIAARVSETKAP